MHTYDAIVIGAGLAGLSAARDLVNGGSDVLVVEARERAGGRVEQTETADGRKVQLGGEIVGTFHTAYRELVGELGLTMGPTFTASSGEIKWMLADGPIKKPEDLKGKVIGTNAAGSAVDVATRAMLRKFGLEDKRDYTVVESPFPTMRAMLAEKKVDLIPGVLPFSLYGASKLAGEALLASYVECFGLTATICRFGNVVGPRGFTIDCATRPICV